MMHSSSSTEAVDTRICQGSGIVLVAVPTQTAAFVL